MKFTHLWMVFSLLFLLSCKGADNDSSLSDINDEISDALSSLCTEYGFYAVGLSGVASYSPDGSSWTIADHNNGNMNGVVYSDGKFVAVGNSGVASYSTDGISWTNANHNNGFMYGIAYGNGRFVAVGSPGGVASYSTDGISWTNANHNNVGMSGIAYGCISWAAQYQ